MRVSSLGEFGAIARIQEVARHAGRDVAVGIGDDAAALRPRPGMMVLAATDMLVEGVHFELSYTPFRQLGYKALAVNISDIAAMAGRPGHYLVSLALGARTQVADLEALIRGMEDAGEAHGVKLIGGDTCSSPGPLVISITILGTVKSGRTVLRRGARPGDDIYVTGTLGDSAAGLEILKAGGRRKGARGGGAPALPAKRTALSLPEGLREWTGAGRTWRGVDSARFYLVARHLTPTPRALAGRLLGEGRLATSMIDVSDGFSSDLSHILEESGVGALVHSGKLPLSPALQQYAGDKGALKYALHGGEDYELIFTASPGQRDRVAALQKKAGTVFTKVGSVTLDRGALIESPGGARRALRPKGYEHFRK